MTSLSPADRKHTWAPLAAASKRPMYAGTRFTDAVRMESWVSFSGKEGHQDIQRLYEGLNQRPQNWEVEILPLRHLLRLVTNGNWNNNLRIRYTIHRAADCRVTKKTSYNTRSASQSDLSLPRTRKNMKYSTLNIKAQIEGKLQT